jgi:hypothetical protein
MNVQDMTRPHAGDSGALSRALLVVIEQCFDCAQTCIGCADACLAERDVEDLRQCIRLNLDCADICEAVGAVAARHADTTGILLRQALQTCLMACELCELECDSHAAHHDHCGICAEACRACKDACAAAAQSLDAL